MTTFQIPLSSTCFTLFWRCWKDSSVGKNVAPWVARNQRWPPEKQLKIDMNWWCCIPGTSWFQFQLLRVSASDSSVFQKVTILLISQGEREKFLLCLSKKNCCSVPTWFYNLSEWFKAVFFHMMSCQGSNTDDSIVRVWKYFFQWYTVKTEFWCKKTCIYNGTARPCKSKASWWCRENEVCKGLTKCWGRVHIHCPIVNVD